MKCLFVIVLLMGALSITSACNTVEGIGKDVKSAGEAISGSSEKTKEKIEQNEQK